MSLVNCPECNNNISETATSCPHCGYKMGRNIPKQNNSNQDSFNKYKSGFILIGFILLFIIIIISVRNKDFKNDVEYKVEYMIDCIKEINDVKWWVIMKQPDGTYFKVDSLITTATSEMSKVLSRLEYTIDDVETLYNKSPNIVDEIIQKKIRLETAYNFKDWGMLKKYFNEEYFFKIKTDNYSRAKNILNNHIKEWVN